MRSKINTLPAGTGSRTALKQTACLVVLVLSLFPRLGFSFQDESLLSKAGINLIPYPQEVALNGDNFVFKGNITIIVDEDASEPDRFAAAHLTENLLEDFDVKANTAESPSGLSIRLTRKGAGTHVPAQGYRLVASGRAITIEAQDEPGLFYGVQTLLQLVQKRTGSPPYVQGIEITDWPDIPSRAVHYDTKHHQDTREYVEKFIRDMAMYKINMLVWEWEDKFAYPSHPDVGAPGAFTMEEMQEFTRYAKKYHIQLVPLVQGLGHVSFILKWPQYAHLREIPASNWEFCPLLDRSYELLFDLWEDAIEATPGSEFIHIGSDETYELGLCPRCAPKAEEIGNSGLYHLFVGRSASHLQDLGRKVMVWESPMGWEKGRSPAKKGIVPHKGIVLTESYSYPDPGFGLVKQSQEMGYPVYAYDPNPGIEHLFLPYEFRLRDGEKTMGSLQDSYEFLTEAANAHVFDGMINTSWDDAGLHNQVWMLSFVTSAEYSWSGMNPGLQEFKKKFFANYYGPAVRDMEELFLLLNEGSYYYMSTFERNVWHHGVIGKTHLPDLPRGDALEYDPYWNVEYAEMVEKSEEMIKKMDRAIAICQANMNPENKNVYDMEVFLSIASLIKHTGQTYLDLSALESAITAAHRQRFLDYEETFAHLEKAEAIVAQQLDRREQVFNDLVATWEKVRLPKGMSTENKEFFHRQDRARHFANRKADMSYLIYDEELLDLQGYLEKLREYMDDFKKTFLTGIMNDE
ncbi:MAG TPA: beta-N-acetylhexosaminidase [Cyclobacteriaceae bacterium]|nr:beta-N-acetylhexosaminidase [Cyclobacteriaceae bacterium]